MMYFVVGCVCLVFGLVVPYTEEKIVRGEDKEKYARYYGWAFIVVACLCFVLSYLVGE